METNERYNGWSNYPTWVVNLWASNDEGAYRYWIEQTREAWDTSEASRHLTRSQEAVRRLEGLIRDQHEEQAADALETASVYADLMSWSLQSVNWEEIAEHWLEDTIEEFQKVD